MDKGKQRAKLPTAYFWVILSNSSIVGLFRQKTLRPILTAAEGFIFGVGAKMFTIAGPVIVCGIAAGVVYGLI